MSGIRKASGSGEARGVVYPFGGAHTRAGLAETPAGVDRAGFTEVGRELARARLAVEASAEVRSNRVRVLKEKIARGEYRPDPRDVARKLLELGF